MNEDPTEKLSGQTDRRLEELFEAVQAMRTDLSDLKKAVDARLHDTRPLGETLELIRADVAQVQDGQGQIRAELRNLARQLSVLNDTFLQFKADHKDLDARLYRLEVNEKS
ncbi:MAG: hypothetical protein ACRD68_08495 [Pyrinomonadaceae bacterium]